MSSSVGAGGNSPSYCARMVKYTPNRPAKNINSLASHTITPTLTMFGRFRVCTRALNAEGPAAGLVAVVTRGLWTAVADHALGGHLAAGRAARGWQGRVGAGSGAGGNR